MGSPIDADALSQGYSPEREKSPGTQTERARRLVEQLLALRELYDAGIDDGVRNLYITCRDGDRSGTMQLQLAVGAAEDVEWAITKLTLSSRELGDRTVTSETMLVDISADQLDSDYPDEF